MDGSKNESHADPLPHEVWKQPLSKGAMQDTYTRGTR